MSSRTIMVAALAAMAAQPLSAQELDSGFEGELIGTVTIGESRRGVRTDTASSITTVEQEELDERQATTLGELVDTVPSVSLVNGNTPQGAAISIRGLGAQSGVYGTDGKVAIVVDGVTGGAEEVYRSGSALSMEPELFKQVTVQRGPAQSFQYSSGAMGGTLELVTKDGRDFLEDGDTFSYRQKLSYESNGDGVLATSIFAWAPDDRFDVLAFAGYRDKGDMVDGDGNTLEATAFEKPSAMLKANYHLSDGSTLTFSSMYDEIPQTDVPYNVFLPSWSDILVDRYIKQATTYAAYRYNPVGNDLINLEARLSFRKEAERITTSEATDSDIYNTDHDTRTVALRVENESLFSTGTVSHTLNAGVELSKRTRSTEELAGTYAGFNARSAPGGTDESISVYIADRMEFGNRFTLTPQLRFEKQKLTSEGNDYAYSSRGTTVAALPDGTSYETQALTGALSARYELSEGFAAFGTAAYNENLPFIDDLRDADRMASSEKGETYELGLSYDSVGLFSGDDRMRFKLTGFKTHIWDGFSYSGIDEVDLEGIELEASYVHSAFYADLNASRIRGTINGTGDYFNYVPADSVQLTLGKRFLDDQLDLAIEAKHAFAQNRTSDTNPDYYPGTVASDDYTLFNLTAAYVPNSGSFRDVEFRASVENLTDETYRAYLSTRNGAGRTFKFSIAKTF